MPMITDAQMNNLANTIQTYETRQERQKEEKKELQKKFEELLMSTLGFGGAALTGFVHGRYEDADGNLFFPRTSIPADLTVGFLGVLAGFYGKLKTKKDQDQRMSEALFEMSKGVLSGATAMYFRKHALAGKRVDKLWAGIPELMGPQTHNYPSIGAAPVHSAMTDSELALALRRTL
jgi:hypothetical protein